MPSGHPLLATHTQHTPCYCQRPNTHHSSVAWVANDRGTQQPAANRARFTGSSHQHASLIPVLCGTTTSCPKHNNVSIHTTHTMVTVACSSRPQDTQRPETGCCWQHCGGRLSVLRVIKSSQLCWAAAAPLHRYLPTHTHTHTSHAASHRPCHTRTQDTHRDASTTEVGTPAQHCMARREPQLQAAAESRELRDHPKSLAPTIPTTKTHKTRSTGYSAGQYRQQTAHCPMPSSCQESREDSTDRQAGEQAGKAGDAENRRPKRPTRTPKHHTTPRYTGPQSKKMCACVCAVIVQPTSIHINGRQGSVHGPLARKRVCYCAGFFTVQPTQGKGQRPTGAVLEPHTPCRRLQNGTKMCCGAQPQWCPARRSPFKGTKCEPPQVRAHTQTTQRHTHKPERHSVLLGDHKAEHQASPLHLPDAQWRRNSKGPTAVDSD